ncbi:MAG TPA: DUF420 domain-containing protein [Saprospiraceae bacterium]|nr:DUF420 domain-containing protein [Saprospiraceae bacterium]MCC6688261.1 DUF420 domain-containing protein [Saprospiraceae bacterium]HMW75773.1 DUF420 domain-containing protein [Saprospiraceae bacterium]HMX83527.1 DUF420 domain-containing protein [Saprospiraceae bacterium]HMZ74307.1 DUF420 domain-containing protein [Saprospiraceae bacterium]
MKNIVAKSWCCRYCQVSSWLHDKKQEVMDMKHVIIVSNLVITVLAPLVAVYAVGLARQGQHTRHLRVQKVLFGVCMSMLVIFELLIRASGGSGSLVEHSTHYGQWYFKLILVSHIVGAVLTYIIWAVMVVLASRKWKRGQLPGKFSVTHKRLGYVTMIGLWYTAVTAVIVSVLAFFG